MFELVRLLFLWEELVQSSLFKVDVITSDETLVRVAYMLFSATLAASSEAYSSTRGTQSFHVSSGFIRPLSSDSLFSHITDIHFWPQCEHAIILHLHSFLSG